MKEFAKGVHDARMTGNFRRPAGQVRFGENNGNVAGGASSGPRSASEIDFVKPSSVAEARRRVADLEYDIAHIDQQVLARQARGRVDLDWWHRAMRARMAKDLERQRLLIWIEEESPEESWAFLKAVFDLARNDYEPEDWEDLLREARESLSGRAGR